MSDLRFTYEPFPDTELPLAARLGQYPRQPDLLWDTARALGRRIAAAFFRLQFRIEVVGEAPDLPRLALMPNHQSHLDTMTILAVLPERFRSRITVLAARDYFFERAPGAGPKPVRPGRRLRPDTEAGRAAPLGAPPADGRGGWFLLYPSGSRKRLEPHAGLAGVLARSGWTVLPIALAGTAEAWPVGHSLWRPFRRLRVTFGEPIADATVGDLPATLLAFWQANDHLVPPEEGASG
jgi:1-acyl-sn-glycerol-3-phosphate acyltransferase